VKWCTAWNTYFERRFNPTPLSDQDVPLRGNDLSFKKDTWHQCFIIFIRARKRHRPAGNVRMRCRDVQKAGMSGGDSGTVGSALVTIVRRLFRWASADETPTSGSSTCVYGAVSTSLSTQHIDSDLNGNLSSADGDRQDDETAKDTFHGSRYRRSLGHGDAVVYCRRCGVVVALKCETTLGKQLTVTFICGRCRQLAALSRREQRLSVDDVDARERLASDGSGDGGGEPVCCCDRCSTVSSRLLRLPSDEFQSKFDAYSSTSTSLLVPSSSLPTSMTQFSASLNSSLSPIQRRRHAMMQAADANVAEDEVANGDPLLVCISCSRVAITRRTCCTTPPTDAQQLLCVTYCTINAFVEAPSVFLYTSLQF